MMQRTRNALITFQKMDRYRGHFYNWYDTRTLRPLSPLYVSSVDSGNLAGHLLTLSMGLLQYSSQPILPSQVFAGLRNTLGILRELVRNPGDFMELDAEMENPPSDFLERIMLLRKTGQKVSELAAAYGTMSEEVAWWFEAMQRACRDLLADVEFLEPWFAALEDRRLIAWAAAQPKPADDRDETMADRIRNLWHTTAEETPSLATLADLGVTVRAAVAGQEGEWMRIMVTAAEDVALRAAQRLDSLNVLAGQAEQFADMDLSFLFDPSRKLLAIGYNVTERQRDQSYYDLLASESRLASYVAVAQRKVSQEHWFTLGRVVAATQGEPVLISWSGSMFEYLMPMLVMPSYDDTLLGASCRGAVDAQIAYGNSRGIPWGISESGYNTTDAALNYQYRAFGVPGLGFKRGLGDDLVIAPYATVMALMVAPKEACENLVRLAAEGREGAYGFYEAVDYTPSRLPRGETCVTIRSFMAHHVGMSLVSLLSVLGEHPMQRRFSSHPIFKAVELLLQERLPKSIASIRNEDLELGAARQLGLTSAQPPLRMFTTPNTPAPEVHLLSNEHYHVVVSNAGGGYSRWRNLAVTRWRPDATRDCYGTFCYVRDLQSGEFWSNAHHPVRRLAKHYEAIFTQARAEFRQRYGALEMHTEISVSPEDDVELRRITITNHSQVTRVLEFTSYAEIVMAAASADNAHPAFSNLFVQTEAHGTLPALLCTRRARSEGEKPPWLLHLMVLQGTEEGTFSYETDRSKFIGRGRSLASPAALQSRSGLSNTTGSVLDPVVSIRRRLRLGPDESGRIEIVMGMTETRERAVTLAEKYHSPAMTDRLLDLAWTHSQVTLRQLDATESDAQLFGHLAGSLVYPNAARRAAAHVLRSNTRAQNGLWSYGISGDLPIVLLRSTDPVRLDVVRRLVQAHAYWRGKGLAVDLVIVNEGPSVYRQPLHDQIVALIASGVENSQLDRPGGIFVRRFDQIPPEDRILLQAAARVVLADDQGTVEDQILAGNSHEMIYPELRLRKSRTPQPRVQLPPRELLFFNGLGGFTPDGHEYVITLHPDGGSAEPRSPGAGDKVAPTKVANHVTPMPWVNVLANPLFGTLISESGGGYTWFENSHEFRLTPWSNDPISDTPGEAFYIRDDETGEFWSPAPGPARGQTPYVVRHGFGYTVFEHTESGVATEMWVYVDVERPVKFVSLKLKNLSGRPRKLSVTGYWEMVLGELRGNTAMHVQSEILPASGAILVRNSYNIDFPGHYCFADVNEAQRTSTADREEFLGRNESPASPAAMRRARLSGRSGAGLDPCAALQVTYELGPNQEREVTFMLGAGRNRGEVENLIHACRQPRAGQSALERVWEYWNRTLGVVQVETPDPAVNVLANGWLLYQTLSCRLWGRTGFYQSGGAFGFRDQLQDTMALVHAEPRLLREQLLRAAAHQFREGDVQHWWHPPVGRGVRTHFSDDYLWLPYATCRYVNCLHDTGVLDEEIPYLESRLLTQDEESVYDLPARAAVSGTLYQHCVRAIENGLKFGEHGLPLIGCGDWNDGFNLIGEHGRGESVWLGFFLYDVLIQFAALARSRNDVNFAELCEQQAEQLQRNIELHAWDGQWYRRAYFDNGEPVGSHANSECQIDALPQSWAVLTRAGDPERSQQAMREVAERLVNHKAGLVQLFDPPFDKGELNPGYIKGYVPGVRENGGQYTHAAIWTVMAFAQAGEIEHAWELFEMINPVEHGRTAEKIAVYKVEPYVVAADVYAVPPHTGRGGWTWYTGSAGWMYRLAVETLLGIEREGDLLHVRPRLPRRWQGFKVHYRFCETAYHIRIDAADGEPSASLDGRTLDGPSFPLRNDRVDHQVEIRVRVGDVVPHLEPAGI
jgi:cyclic beta-1,2-glucan synthetase